MRQPSDKLDDSEHTQTSSDLISGTCFVLLFWAEPACWYCAVPRARPVYLPSKRGRNWRRGNPWKRFQAGLHPHSHRRFIASRPLTPRGKSSGAGHGRRIGATQRGLVPSGPRDYNGRGHLSLPMGAASLLVTALSPAAAAAAACINHVSVAVAGQMSAIWVTCHFAAFKLLIKQRYQRMGPLSVSPWQPTLLSQVLSQRRTGKGKGARRSWWRSTMASRLRASSARWERYRKLQVRDLAKHRIYV